MAENEIKSINGRNVCDQTARDTVNNITVPTKTSDLTNDNGFATETYVTSKIDDTTTATNKTWSSSKIDSQIKEIANSGGSGIIFENIEVGEIFTSVEEVIECTGISLSSNTLIFNSIEPQTLTATVLPSNCTEIVTWTASPSGIVSISNGVITPLENGECTITVTCGSQSATCSVTISGILKQYSITNNLTNITTNNTDASIAENASYTAILTANENYAISTVTITMGGVDITDTAYTNGSITIGAVTGNIIITAVAKSTSAGSATKVNIETIDGQDYFVINAENLKSNSGTDLFVTNSYSNDLYQLYTFNNSCKDLIDFSVSKIVYSISDTIERLSGDDKDTGNQYANVELFNSSYPGDLYVNTGSNNDGGGNLTFRFPKDLTGYNDNIYDYIKAKYGGLKLAKSPSCLVKEIVPDNITSINIQQNNETSQYAYFGYTEYPAQNIYSGYNSLSSATATNTNLDAVTYLPAAAMSTSRLSIKFKPGTFKEFTLDAVKEYLTQNPLIFWYK